MANNKRGRRGGATRGFSGKAQGSRTSQAQSGGKSTTFGGGKGGGAWQAPGGGDRPMRTKHKGEFANGTNYNVRGSGGDNSLVQRSKYVGGVSSAGKVNRRGAPTEAYPRRPRSLGPNGAGGAGGDYR